MAPTRVGGARPPGYGQSMVDENRRVRQGLRAERATRRKLAKRQRRLPVLRGAPGAGPVAVTGRQPKRLGGFGGVRLPKAADGRTAAAAAAGRQLTRVTSFAEHATAPLRRSGAPRLRGRPRELVSSYNPYIGSSSTVGNYKAFLAKAGF